MTVSLWQVVVFAFVLLVAIPLAVGAVLLVLVLKRKASRPAAERLAELDDLLHRKLISDEEHVQRRAEIINGL